MEDNLEKAIEEVVGEVVHDALKAGYNNWINSAQQNLGRRSSSRYIEGISPPVMTSATSGYLELKGTVPNDLEHGKPSFDMKPGFRSSPFAKKSESGGWYLTVPFAHQIPETGVNPMPRDIYKGAKELNHKESLKEAFVEALGYKKETSHTGYTWKNRKYDGLTRYISKKSDGRKDSHYTTFRRVSDKSDPKSWQHPGIKGIHVMDKVADDMENFIYQALESEGL